MIVQNAVDLVELCALHGVNDVILCPGSRSAALTIAFVRSGKFKTYSISDERSAAYIAMGMSQKSKQPTVVLCTSGTAALNFGPAVAEAFFLKIPLIVITADRPAEWIDQYDGQTIFQKNIYSDHVVGSYQLNSDRYNEDQVWAFQRQANEALIKVQQGPVHINMAIKEPFYPEVNEQMLPSAELRKIENIAFQVSCNYQLKILPKTIFVVGQQFKSLSGILPKNAVVISDVISNFSETESVHFHDVFDFEKHLELKPDMIVSLGMSLISKNLKLFLRKNKTAKHVHIQNDNAIHDPLQSISEIINAEPEDILKNIYVKELDIDFKTAWLNIENKAKLNIKSYLNDSSVWSEVFALNRILKTAPSESILCLGNSMSVRYANVCPSIYDRNLKVYANRGTSGIDGCISTAIGIALKTTKTVTCVVGDVSFFYDRNALWNSYVPKNFRLVVLNNFGGAIFNMIDGPARQPEATEYFITKQPLSIKNTILDTTLAYFEGTSKNELPADFYEGENAKALELKFEKSAEHWKAFKTLVSV